MADENDQNVCSFIASIFRERQSLEALLQWLRQSQTTCTDTNCFDDLSGLPGTEIGARFDPNYSQQDSETDQLTPLLWMIFGLFTLFALNLSRGRQRGLEVEKGAHQGPNMHGPRNERDRRDDDDHRPAV